MKILTMLALASLLAACGAGVSASPDTGLPSAGQSVVPPDSASVSEQESPNAISCTEAFANLDAAAVAALGRLDAASDLLDTTIAACSSADEWEAAAESALPDLDMTNARAFVAARCSEATTLVGAAICSELGS
jgi:hypothetical protein